MLLMNSEEVSRWILHTFKSLTHSERRFNLTKALINWKKLHSSTPCSGATITECVGAAG